MSAIAHNGLPRPLAFGALLIALAFVLAFAASTAQASFQQTDGWDIPGNGRSGGAHDVAIDPGSGDLFTGFGPQNLSGQGGFDDPGKIHKWDPSVLGGNPGTPASFGGAYSADSRYAGVAINPTNHNVYALVDVVDDDGDPASPAIAIYQADGTPVTSFSVAASENAGIDVDASGNVYVPDTASGVVNKYDSSGTLLDTTSGGTLNYPLDAAVDSAGNLYVADRSSSRVNEQQTIDLEGATSGTYRLSFNGEHTGVDFTGDISYGEGTGDVVLADGTADRARLADGTGDLTAGSATVTDISVSNGTFAVGESLTSGTNQSKIPFGAEIDSCTPDCSSPTEITLSKPAKATAADAAIFSGDKTLTNVTNVNDFEVGMAVNATAGGFPAPGLQHDYIGPTTPGADAFVAMVTNVEVTDDNATPGDPSDDIGELTLSDGVTSTGSGNISGEYVVDADATDGAFEVGQLIKGPFNACYLPFVGTITAVSGPPGDQTLIVADLCSAAAETNDSPLQAAKRTITNLDVSSGQYVGREILALSGDGVPTGTSLAVIPAGINWDLVGNTARTNWPSGLPTALPFTQGGTGVEFHADLKYTATGKGGGGTGAEDYDDLEMTLESLPSIGASVLYSGTLNVAETNAVDTPSPGIVEFGRSDLTPQIQSWFQGRNVSEMTCAPAPANPIDSGSCSVTTTQEGGNTPGRVAKFDSSLDSAGDFVTPSTDYSAAAVEVDRTTDDVYVAAGNGDWGNPQDVITGPDAPYFSVKRYDSAGSELDEIGAGILTPNTYASGGTSLVVPPVLRAFGLSFDPTTQRLYTVTRRVDLAYSGPPSVVKVFTAAHPVTVTADGNGSGSVDADSGAIAGCTDSAGVCADDYLFGETVTLTATPGAESTVSWTGCDNVPSANECEVDIDGAKNVTATFTLNEYTLDLTVSGSGVAQITSSPAGIDCDENNAPDCEQDYPFGTGPIVLTAALGTTTTVSWGGACDSSTATTCTINSLDGDESVTATLSVGQFSVTVNHAGTGASTVEDGAAGGIETCRPSSGTCIGNYDDLSTVTLTATPDAHNQIVGWGGTCDANPAPNTCEVDLNGSNRSVTLTTDEIVFGLGVTVDGNGNGTVSADSGGISACDSGGGANCSDEYLEDTAVTLTATPGAESTVSWSGDCTPSGNTCETTMSEARSVTATFTLNTYAVNVDVQGTGEGSVASDVGAIDCDETGNPVCADDYDFGATVMLTATPALHSQFVSWAGCDNPSGNTCEVDVSGVENVTATFDQILHNVAVDKDDGTGAGSVTADSGAINCGTTCDDDYVEGTTVLLTATPALHSELTGWTGDCDSNPSPDTCQVEVDAAKDIHAVFDLIFHDLNVSHDGSGSGAVDADFGAISGCTPSGGTCTDNLVEGAIITLTATAASDSTFEGWAGCTSSSGNQCTVELNAEANVTATFDEIPADDGGGDGGGSGGGGGDTGGGDTGGGDGSGDDTTPQAGILITGNVAPVRGRLALVRVRCAGQGDCRGQARLLARVVTRRVIRRGNRRRVIRKPRNLVVGRSAFAMAQGQGGVVRVRLTGQGLRLVRRARRGLRTRIVGPGLRNKALVLKQVRPKRNTRNRNRNRR